MKHRYSHAELRLIEIVFALLAVSAALTYWITHDHHRISRRIPVAQGRPQGPVLERNMPVYCPICGESVPKKEDQ